jgi:L-alanine-DL-glutamate epimerase-like enolase superfamily enzyme
LKDLLIGEDPLADPQQLWDKLYIGSSYYGRRGVALHCISAIDDCLWSIRAQAANKPLGELLGGRKHDRVTAYASTLFRETSEAMFAAASG